MKIVILILIPIIILAIVNKTGILPYKLYYILVSLIVVIGSFFFLKCASPQAVLSINCIHHMFHYERQQNWKQGHFGRVVKASAC